MKILRQWICSNCSMHMEYDNNCANGSKVGIGSARSVCLSVSLLTTKQAVSSSQWRLMKIQSAPNSAIELKPRRWVVVDRRSSDPRREGRVGSSRRARSRHQVQDGRRSWFKLVGEIKSKIVDLMLVNFAITVQFIAGSALEVALGLPGYPGHTLQVPPDEYDILRRLPNPKYLQGNIPEQYSTVEPQCPEDQLVILDSSKFVQRV